MTSTIQKLFFSLDRLHSDVKWYEGSFDLTGVDMDMDDELPFQIPSFSDEDRFQELHAQMAYFLTEGPKCRTYIRRAYEKLISKFLEATTMIELFKKIMDQWEEVETKIWSLLFKRMSLPKWPRITDLVDQLAEKLQYAQLVVRVAAEKLKMERDEMKLWLQEPKSSQGLQFTHRRTRRRSNK